MNTILNSAFGGLADDIKSLSDQQESLRADVLKATALVRSEAALFSKRIRQMNTILNSAFGGLADDIKWLSDQQESLRAGVLKATALVRSEAALFSKRIRQMNTILDSTLGGLTDHLKPTLAQLESQKKAVVTDSATIPSLLTNAARKLPSANFTRMKSPQARILIDLEERLPFLRSMPTSVRVTGNPKSNKPLSDVIEFVTVSLEEFEKAELRLSEMAQSTIKAIPKNNRQYRKETHNDYIYHRRRAQAARNLRLIISHDYRNL